MKLTLTALIIAVCLSAETFTGVITDSMCGENHAMMKISPADKCVRECMKHGNTKYVLHDGKTTYKLSDQQTPAKFAAQKVEVKGKLYAKTGVIAVETIAPVK